MTVSKPAVRVPVGAAGLARRVVDLAHLVHVDERVEVGQVDPGEGPAHREALALEALRRGGDRPDRPVDGAHRGPGDAGEGEGVGGDGGHCFSNQHLRVQLLQPSAPVSCSRQEP